MNLLGLFKLVLRFPPMREAKPHAPRPPRRRSRGTLAWFAAAFFSLNIAAFLAIDASDLNLRDPEYGRRLRHLKRRIAEHPERPLVVVIGSSRTSMGVRPSAWEAFRPGSPNDPLIFNMSLVGSGPLMELMCLRRLHDDGIRPDAVILEYWPPFLREDGPYYEPSRIDHARLRDSDRTLVRDYWDHPEETERLMRRDRLNPLFQTRQRLLAQVFPLWQPWDKRVDLGWMALDEWGWLAGLEETYPPKPEARQLRLQACEKIYRPQFVEGYSIHPLADRAFREAVAEARSHGAKAAIAYLPESSEFRSWMPDDVERTAQNHLAKLRSELNVPLINLRHAMPDGYLVDGFHLSKDGATAFTKTFGPAVIEAFPGLEKRR
ncbi:MAG: hypothetical protein U0791_06610 [Gemmataceae bacterium]